MVDVEQQFPLAADFDTCSKQASECRSPRPAGADAKVERFATWKYCRLGAVAGLVAVLFCVSLKAMSRSATARTASVADPISASESVQGQQLLTDNVSSAATATSAPLATSSTTVSTTTTTTTVECNILTGCAPGWQCCETVCCAGDSVCCPHDEESGYPAICCAARNTCGGPLGCITEAEEDFLEGGAVLGVLLSMIGAGR